MNLARATEGLTLTADQYRLVLANDRPYAYLKDVQGRQLADLFVPSSIHTLAGRDDTTALGQWTVSETPNAIVLTLTASSSIWQSKTYRLRCQPHRLVYDMEVEGTGALAEVNYLGGYCSAERRWGSGFFWSGQYWMQLFNPEPNKEEINYLAPSGGAVIDLTGVPLPIRGGWFFTPPPFCYACQTETGWLSLGVEAAPGENRFTEYHYHGQIDGFHLTLSYEGHTRVNGRYRLPAIGIDFADSEFNALKAHVNALQQAGDAPPSSPEPKPSWWYEPIFCGWGAQSYLWSIGQGTPMDFARQEHYEDFLRTLEQNGIDPGTVTIDDKWQMTYGENSVDQAKWRDLRGFVEGQHARGRYVLLWLRAWGAEGLPDDECIVNARGIPITCDPSNPKFERRLRESVERMLSPQGYNADGFKIDFTGRSPSGPDLRPHGDVWGLELMRLYLGIIHDQAKRTKPDALLIAHTPHPYLADVVDMIRLNDLNPRKDVITGMYLRARVAAIGCTDALIDTDNWQTRDKAQWREYTQRAAELGVPSLYYVSHIDATQEPFDAADYALIRETWARYRERLRLET